MSVLYECAGVVGVGTVRARRVLLVTWTVEVLQCADDGIESHGVELNSILVAYSKYAALKAGKRQEAKFYCRDIFKTDMNTYNTAVIFGAEMLMGDLVPKLSEMRAGTSLIACRFPLPDNEHWMLTKQIGEGIDAVWLYKRL